ncbi:AsnC family transcriptional regulator [Candidatus Bathyarchaeota archaeon]|nr:AsnC family transcriptional regulator [Candidatus Bathyarchaeota archaeon]MBS7628848.1 AsnC family transcriptional regulator [Candidatus Bathyarchaeota archaeon]
MDEIDLFIIKRMTEDARVSFRKIAKELGISPDTVITRHKTLQEKGAIRGSTVVINLKKIGYHEMVAFMIDASPSYILANETTPTEPSLILKS